MNENVTATSININIAERLHKDNAWFCEISFNDGDYIIDNGIGKNQQPVAGLYCRKDQELKVKEMLLNINTYILKCISHDGIPAEAVFNGNVAKECADRAIQNVGLFNENN